MSSGRHMRAKEVFLAACECPPEERAAFLERECGDDRELRQDVDELLAFDLDETALPSHIQDSPGSVKGYFFVQKIGEGGMGEVWQAEQRQPVRRMVAVKLIKWGMDTKEVVARFESERQALALMDHPNVAHVLEAGATDQGRPFFAMEFVEGMPITKYCDSCRLPTDERLELFARVCDGVQHAHQKGIIHRDLKPSNVLVTVQQEGPVPKIIDFGVAKATAQRLTERTLFTERGQWIGTPEYMSPEQADLTAMDVDTRTDVYSLGVLLYELLVGAQPFDSEKLRQAGFDEMRRFIREVEPPRPSTRVSSLGDGSQAAAQCRRTDPGGLVRTLRGDLDWIVMRALDKDRTRRYGSPAELAADVSRHLANEPVLASPPSTVYRLRKFVRRHRVGVATAALITLAVAGGLAGTGIGLVRAREEAEAARRVSDLLVGMFEAMDPGSIFGGASSVDVLLERGVERIDIELEGQPLIRARLKNTLGRAYLGLGRFDRAELLIEEAIALRREHLGDGHHQVAAGLEGLGELSFNRGDYEEARQRFERALEIRSYALGKEHPSVGRTLNDLGFVLLRLGEHEQARELNARAIEILDVDPGQDSAQLADALYFKQVLLHEERRYNEAIRVCERVLAIRERLFGPNHMGVGWALFDLGLLHQHAGDILTGRAFLERASEVQTEALGADHWATSYPLERLASLDSREGDLELAGARFERALTIRRSAMGHAHPEVALLRRRYASHLLRAGELERAEEHLQLALSQLETRLGTAHPEVTRSLVSLGLFYHHLGDLDSACDSYLRSLEIGRRIYPPDRGTSLYRLACIAARRGQRRQALDHLETLLTTAWANPIIFDDSDLDSLRGDPDFEAILSKIRSRS